MTRMSFSHSAPPARHSGIEHSGIEHSGVEVGRRRAVGVPRSRGTVVVR